MTFFALLVFIFLCLVVASTIYLLLRPMVAGAIYFPTMPTSVAVIRRFAAAEPGKKIADLGSGDGRILIALAADGAEAHGYEINPLLVAASRRRIRNAGLAGRAIVHWQSFWKADLSHYDAVVVYGFPPIMKRLGRKLMRELRPGSTVISNVYHFHEMRAGEEENKVLRYTIGAGK